MIDLLERSAGGTDQPQGIWTDGDVRGKVVYRDHGRIVTTYLFDTLGDSMPGGEYLEDPVELKNTWDPDFDFCAFADDLIG